jgi:excisionase family DNA binding protein
VRTRTFNVRGSFRQMMTARSRSTAAPRGRQSERRPAEGFARRPRAGEQAEHRSTNDSAAVAALPILPSADEAADLLRTSRRAIYAMVERNQLPGVTRIGRRMLFRGVDLLRWIDRKRAPSSPE